MKFSKKFLAAWAMGLIALAGCTYDDTALTERVSKVEKDVSELRTLVEGLNVNIKALVTTVDALKNADQITAVEKLPDGSGYTVTYSKSGMITIVNGKNGLDGNNGKDGVTPLISVRLDADGTYYWTVNGGYLLDDKGAKIPATAHIATPQIRINAGNFEISYNNGTTWEVIGTAGAQDAVVFKQVIDGEASVKFVLADGTEITIPKARQFVINVASTTVIMKPGQTANVFYTIAAGDANTVVDAFATKGFAVAVSASNATSGRLTITAPDPLTDGKVYLFAVKGDGTTAARIFSCEEGVFTIDETAFAVHVPAAGGHVKVPVSTNMQYFAMVDPAYGWIKLLDTRAVRKETLTFEVAENTSKDPREGIVIVSNDLIGRKRYSIIQDGASSTPGGGSADLGTFNNGQKTSVISTYTSTDGWKVDNTKLLPLEIKFPEYPGIRPVLRGIPSEMGVLTSPIISGGCGKLTFIVARTVGSNAGNRVKIEIKDKAGNVLKTKIFTNETLAQYVAQTYSFDFNVAGEFQIVATNITLHNSSLAPDDFAILDLTWTGFAG